MVTTAEYPVSQRYRVLGFVHFVYNYPSVSKGYFFKQISGKPGFRVQQEELLRRRWRAAINLKLTTNDRKNGARCYCLKQFVIKTRFESSVSLRIRSMAKKGGILEKGNAVQRQCVCKKVEVGLLGMNLTEPWSSEKNCAERQAIAYFFTRKVWV